MSWQAACTGQTCGAGNYVARILKGAQPSDLPVVQPIKFELVINLKAAQTLDLCETAIVESLLRTALAIGWLLVVESLLVTRLRRATRHPHRVFFQFSD